MADLTEHPEQPAPAPRPAVALEHATPRGYDVGLHTATSAGPLDVSVSVESTTGPRAVALVLDAPGVGRLGVSLAVEAGGAPRVVSLQAPGEDGRLVSRPSRERTLERSLAELRARLARESARAATAERELALLRASRLEEALAPVAAQVAALSQAAAEGEVERGRRLALETEREALARSLERAEAWLESERAQSARLGEELLSGEQAKGAVELELSTAQGALARAAEELSGARRELDALREAAAEAAKSQLRTDAHAAEVMALKRLVAETSVSAGKAQAEVRDAQARTAALSSALDLERARLLQASQAHDALSERLAPLEAERDALKAQLAAMREQAAAPRPAVRPAAPLPRPPPPAKPAAPAPRPAAAAPRASPAPVAPAQPGGDTPIPPKRD